MGGKRRAEPVRRHVLPTWVWGALAVLAVLALAWFTVPLVVGGDPATPPTSAPSPSRSTPSPTPSSTPRATPPPPTPTTPADLPHLASDQPRRMSVAGVLDVRFDDAVAASGGTLAPASSDRVSRWRDRGSPGSPGEDAVVVVGRQDASKPAAFSALGSLKPGARIRLRTDRGTLTYTVAKTLEVPDAELLRSPAITSRTPGRLVLVGDKYAPSGDRLTTDHVVVAILTGAAPA